jgi:hypothetical protein
MDEPVTAFPFNITGAPMYYGSSLSFLGTALLYGRPAGVLLSGLVFGVYKVALGFEEYVDFNIFWGGSSFLFIYLCVVVLWGEGEKGGNMLGLILVSFLRW